jgi:hypothetical protein
MKAAPMPGMTSLPARTFIGGCGVYLLLTACGAWGSSPTAPEPAPTGPTVTIANGALSVRAIEIPVGGRLSIVNRDAVAHDMGSDPHPGHEDCPELNLIGMLEPGRTRTSGNLVEPRICGMHDHIRHLDTALHLRVTIR